MGQKKVPVKTPEGAWEIKTRVLGLAPRIRTALLLVDGVRSATELERLMQAAGVTPGALQLLLDKGLIRFPEDDRQDSVPIPMVATTASKPVPDDQPTLFLEPMTVQPAVPTLTSVVLSAESIEKSKEESKEESKESAPEKTPEKSPERIPEKLPKKSTSESSKKPIQESLQKSTAELPKIQPKVAAPAAPNPLEVMTLLEIETILGGATELEVETIMGIATKLEATPTQALAPDTVVKAPPRDEIRLPPLAQAQRAYRAAATVEKKVIPASILQMNLMVARAHLANALDQYMEIDGYLLKQKVVACGSRTELEQLFRQVEAGLIQRMEKPAAARIMGIARALLER
jgi:hypothetical protein